MIDSRGRRTKKIIYKLIQQSAAAVFIGLAVFGAITFIGAEATRRIPPATSLILGGIAVACVAVIIFIGSMLDRIEAEDEMHGGGKGDIQGDREDG